MAQKTEKKGIPNQTVDAVSARNERAAAEAKTREAEKLIAEADAAKKAAQAEAFKATIVAKEAEQRARMAELAAKGAQERAEREDKAKAEAKAKADAEVAAHTYVVRPGDSLSKIAKEVWGDAGRWPEILEANKDKIANANMIRVGQELHIP